MLTLKFPHLGNPLNAGQTRKTGQPESILCSGEGIPQGHEDQGVGITEGHLVGWLPQQPF